MSSQKQSTNNNNKKVTVQPERKLFQFSEFKELEEEPVKGTNLVVEPEKKKLTGPWSDDLVEDRDDPSWITVKRKSHKGK